MSLASRIREKEKSRPSLSLAMIVKNEAATLEKCLQTAAPYVDEIVIVDTGSTDGTREIARRYADRYDEIEWPNSFSKARNHSLSMVSSDYFIFLDGDEYIEAPASWRRIRSALDIETVAALAIPMQNELGEGTMISSRITWLERVIRNHPDIRFEGRVHNQITPSVNKYIRKTGTVYEHVDALAVHVGYSYDRDKMKKKYAPRLSLLRKEMREAESNVKRAYYGYQLGVALYIMQEFDEVLDLYERVEVEHMTEDNAYHFLLTLAQTALSTGNADLALETAARLIRRRKKEPVGYFAAANALMQKGEMNDGMLMTLEAFELNAAQSSDLQFGLNDARLFSLIARVCRGSGYTSMADTFEAMSQDDDYSREKARLLVRHIETGLVGAEHRRSNTLLFGIRRLALRWPGYSPATRGALGKECPCARKKVPGIYAVGPASAV